MRIVVFGWADSAHVQRWVTGLHSRGIDVKLISLGGTTVDGVETRIYPHRSAPAYFIRSLQAVWEARAYKPDLVHVHYAGGFGLWGLLAQVSPTLVSVWGADIMESVENRAMKAAVRLILRKATWVSATSHFLADICAHLSPETRDKLSIIPFGVDVPPSASPFPEEDPVRLCFLKMHRPKYGPDVLLKAMAVAVKQSPRLMLSIAGRGEMTPQLRSMVIDLGLERHVTFAGFVERSNIYDFITQHHFMVMPSVSDSESFGVAALEAGACGRPVIASRVGGVPEVVLNGRTGILVPRNDVDALASAILTLANEPEARLAMGQAAYEYVRNNYSWNQSLDQMTSLYERLIDEHKKKHPAV